MACPAAVSTCTVGTTWKSAFSELGAAFHMIMPTPPASLTAWLLSVRLTTPRWHSTILPVTLAGSSEPSLHTVASSAVAGALAAVAESISGADGTAAPTPTPVYVFPLPRVADLLNPVSCVPAATVVSHGIALSTVDGAGPELPAAAETNTPAAAACMKASSSGPNPSRLSPIEKLMTSTPSATAWSMAATMSTSLPDPPVPVSHSTL